jgi:hypothetical protein
MTVTAGVFRVSGTWLDRAAGGGALTDLGRGGTLALAAGTDTLTLALSPGGALTLAVTAGNGIHDIFLDLLLM